MYFSLPFEKMSHDYMYFLTAFTIVAVCTLIMSLDFGHQACPKYTCQLKK